MFSALTHIYNLRKKYSNTVVKLNFSNCMNSELFSLSKIYVFFCKMKQRKTLGHGLGHVCIIWEKIPSHLTKTELFQLQQFWFCFHFLGVQAGTRNTEWTQTSFAWAYYVSQFSHWCIRMTSGVKFNICGKLVWKFRKLLTKLSPA